jgi:NTE family protein
MKNNKKIGLALSGGGYRAAAFHLGVFSKLNKLNLLEHIDVISTISGGSIAGAYYLLNKDDYSKFELNFIKALQKSVIKKILFSRRIIITIVFLFLLIATSTFIFIRQENIAAFLAPVFLFIILVFYFQFFFLPFSNQKEKAYRKIFFNNNKLSDFPDSPVIAINSTNLETGTLFTFSKLKVSDSSYEYPKDGIHSIKFRPETFNISFAVACSTAVPVPFNPFKLAREHFKNEENYKRVSPSLSDGGLYDNQGIHKLTQPNSSYECDVIICSDGSQPFSFKYRGFNSFSVLYRSTDIMMRKIKSLQFIRDVYSKQKSIAYFSLDWEYEKCVEYFIRAIKDDKISNEIIRFHNINHELIIEIRKNNFVNAIVYIKDLINYTTIIEDGISSKESMLINKIKTNLTALSKMQIELLSKHASVLLELQLRLYCPTLIN